MTILALSNLPKFNENLSTIAPLLMKVDLEHGGDNALWQWFCAAVLLSARIKSTAGKSSHNRNFIDVLKANRDYMSSGQPFLFRIGGLSSLIPSWSTISVTNEGFGKRRVSENITRQRIRSIW